MNIIDKSFNLSSEIIKSHVKANMMDILALEPYEVMVKHDFDTACWCYDLMKDTHKIYIGDNIFERTKEGFVDNGKIVTSYFIHEAAHSIFTTKDLRGLQKELKEEKLNFKLFNLFEDARIEHKIRDTFGYNFNWTSFEEVPADSDIEKATTTLFKIIQTEDRESFDVPYYEKVKEYYKRITSSTSDKEMIKIMQNWIKDFPDDTKPENNKNQSNSKNEDNDNNNGKNEDNGSEKNEEKSDLELAAELQLDSDFASEFEEDTKTVIGDSKKALDALEEELMKEIDVKFLNPVESGEQIVESSNSGRIFTAKEFEEKNIFPDKLEKAEERLRRILKSVEFETINTSSHDKKFHIKGVVQALCGNPSAKPYKKNVEDDYEETKKRVFILMDGSSSMSGLPQKNMLTFAVVANRLANQNLFEGWIGGSKVTENGQAETQAFRLPIDDGFITSFNADASSEGIGAAIRTHKEHMEQSDYIFVLTDGNIHDEDLQFLKHESPDLYEKTIGIYMGKKAHSNISDMEKWFNKTIIEPNFEDIVEKVVSFLDPETSAHENLFELELKTKEENAKFEEVFTLNRI